MSPPTDPEPLNLARERFEYSLDNLLRIDTKMKRVASTEEKDVDQVIDSPLSELDDEEMAALSIAAIQVPGTDNSKRLDKAKTSNLTAPKPTVPTSENVHRLPSISTST